MVVGDTFLVVKTEEPIDVPPQEPVYQRQYAPVPRPPPFIVRVELCPMQIVFGEAETESASSERVFTVMVLLTQIVVLQEPIAFI